MRRKIRRLTRKAQISQVFTYIIIILVVGLLALFGYKAINWILQSQCEHQRVSFEKNLVGYIEAYSDYGSVNEEALKAPCKVTQVCFADSRYYEGLPSPTMTPGVISSHINDKVDNIFVKADFLEPIGFSRKITLKTPPGVTNPPPYKCFNMTGGEFRFLFSGLGKKTLIEPD